MGAVFVHSSAKRNRVRTPAECLQLFKQNSADFLRRFVMMDETWIHSYAL